MLLFFQPRHPQALHARRIRVKTGALAPRPEPLTRVIVPQASPAPPAKPVITGLLFGRKFTMS